jgi:hypothetical protein
MLRDLALAAILSASVSMSYAQSQSGALHYDRHNLVDILGFEVRSSGDLPTGWSGGPAGTVSLEGDVVHSGSWAVILDRSAHLSGNFSTITTAIPIDFAGATIELRGFLRTRDVSGFAGLWMREAGDAGALEFDNSQRQKIAGTHDWQEFSVGLPLNADATHLFFGALLSGTGRAWVDDLQ